MRIVTAAALCALLLSAPASAQDRDNRWRRALDRLTSRWSDDPGSDRLRRARVLIEARLEKTDDPEALLELSRVRLAAEPLNLRDRARAARLQAEGYRLAREHADKAATQLLLRDQDGKLRDKGGRRHHTALALGLIATQAHFQEALRARRLSGSKPAELKGLIGAQAAELQKRRTHLTELVGAETVAKLMQAELRHRETLRALDRLGAPPPPVGILDLQGKAIDLSTARGKPVLILFWTTKIPACAEVLALVKAVKEAQKDDLVVVAISLESERKTLDTYLASNALPWRHAHGPKGLASSIARAWKLREIPDGVLLDHRGVVRYVRPWRHGKSWLTAAIEELKTRRDESEE